MFHFAVGYSFRKIASGAFYGCVSEMDNKTQRRSTVKCLCNNEFSLLKFLDGDK